MMAEQSWVIWFNTGLYTYAWGETKEEALAKYLAIWEKGVASVVEADNYKDALPPHLYLHPPANADWGIIPPVVPGSALYDENGKLKEV
jgi:hypothetical protein